MIGLGANKKKLEGEKKKESFRFEALVFFLKWQTYLLVLINLGI